MRITFGKSALSGKITICPSKSYEQRVLAISAIAGTSLPISNQGHSADVEACRIISKSLQDRDNSTKYNCGESALCARMFPPIIALQKKDFFIDGTGSLSRRKIANDLSFYKELFSWNISEGDLPIHISNAQVHPGTYEIDGRNTSQAISGLILALTAVDGDSRIIVRNPVSTYYILMTVDIANQSGANINAESSDDSIVISIKGNTIYKNTEFNVEGDWSNAAFFLAAGTNSNGISISGLNPKSSQPDRHILAALDKCNAKYEWNNDTISIYKSSINGFDFDATNCPDLIPPLCLLAVNSHELCNIKGANRLIGKESNRQEAIIEELAKIGISVTSNDDILTIHPCHSLKQGTVDSHNDHRIAMMLSFVALQTEGITLLDSGCTKKSYPDFFEDLEKIGARITRN